MSGNKSLNSRLGKGSYKIHLDITVTEVSKYPSVMGTMVYERDIYNSPLSSDNPIL